MTLVELIVAFTILALLSTLAVPLARYKVKRDKERDLRYALREIRSAIDRYKDASDQQKIQVKVGTDGYPEDLDVLVEGVTLVGNATGAKIKFLRRIPIDPMTGTSGVGQAKLAGRSQVEQLGRAECFRCLFEEHGPGARWNSLFGVAVKYPPASRGYTLIELIIVMAIISILMAIAVPQYQKSLRRTKESMLHSHLQTLRTVIDEYTFDKKKAPQTLQDLVSGGLSARGTHRSHHRQRSMAHDQRRFAHRGGPDAAGYLRCPQPVGPDQPGGHSLFGVVKPGSPFASLTIVHDADKRSTPKANHGIQDGRPGPYQFPGRCRETNADLDRDAASRLGQLRSPHRAGLRLADLGRSQLLVRALECLGAAAGDPVSGAELVRRFARRHAGARAQPAASALRVLRGSHPGRPGNELSDGGHGSFRLHVAAGGGQCF